MLLYLIERLKKCSTLEVIVVATSSEKSDDEIYCFCENNGIFCFRGSLTNVAERFINIINNYHFDAFIRISGDSPLLDQSLVTRAVQIFCESSHDIVTNVLKRSFPKGQSVEVIRSDVYRTHYPLFVGEYDHEHVTPYFYRNKEKFNIFSLESNRDWGAVQLSIDTAEDLRVIGKMIDFMNKPHWQYDLESLMVLREKVQQAEEAINGDA